MCASARVCTWAVPTSRPCITWSMKWWITPSTKPWPGSVHRIEITIHADSSVTVEDNGRGIPVGTAPDEEEIGALEVVMTMLHAGGKFGGGGYKVSGGLHGVGVCAVNALSEWCEVEVRRDGKSTSSATSAAIPRAPSRQIGKVTRTIPAPSSTFKFDTQIFKETSITASIPWSSASARWHSSPAASRIQFVDERADREMTFYFEGGITSFVRYLNRNRENAAPGRACRKGDGGIGIEAAIQYTDAYTESVYSFANTINTIDGGTHLTGLRSALTRVINDYARKNGLLKDADPNFSGDDTREGLTAIVSVKHPDPQFEVADQGQADEPRSADLRHAGGGRGLQHLPGREPAGSQGDHCQMSHLGPGPRCGPQGARPGHPQVGARSR